MEIDSQTKGVSVAEVTSLFSTLQDGTHSKLRRSLSLSKDPAYSGVTIVGLTVLPTSENETERFPGIENIVGQGLGMASDDGKELIFQRNSNQVLRVYAAQLSPENTTIPSDVREVKEKLLNDFKGWDPKLLQLIEKADEGEKPTLWKRHSGDPDFKREIKLGAELVGDANMALTSEVSR